jgi:hydrogenase expression/formation protein HypE
MTVVEDMALFAACPIPITHYPKVLLSHGSGGRLMQQLIEQMFYKAFGNPDLLTRHDSAIFTPPSHRLAFSTDSYVVNPLFFPGGDIGTLAVYGTINDLSMCGARPLYLSVSFIIEEGLAMEDLWKIVQSMRKAVDSTGIRIITGDTKVVNKGKGDGIFINTTGIGVLEHSLTILPSSIQPEDLIILSGDIGRHSIAIMAQREGLAFETDIKSDCAPLFMSVSLLLDNGINLHCLRDVTRGGLAAVLNEISQTAGIQIEIEEASIPISDGVRGACEILGLNPLHLANEGCFVAFVSKEEGEKTVEILKQDEQCKHARIIGKVTSNNQAVTLLKSRMGGCQILDMPSGELLPRIC